MDVVGISVLHVVVPSHFVELSPQKNVGQQFKREAKIKNLPPILKASRQKSSALLESEERQLGICSLFTPDDVTV